MQWLTEHAKLKAPLKESIQAQELFLEAEELEQGILNIGSMKQRLWFRRSVVLRRQVVMPMQERKLQCLILLLQPIREVV